MIVCTECSKPFDNTDTDHDICKPCFDYENDVYGFEDTAPSFCEGPIDLDLSEEQSPTFGRI